MRFFIFLSLLFPLLAMAQDMPPGEKVILESENFAPMFPFVISKVPQENVTNVPSWPGNEVRPAGVDGFIRVENGEFVNDRGVVKFFGTNLTSQSCFPETHEDAEFLAKSLARFGINIVRLHFIDTPWGLLDDKTTLTKISEEKLEKLDYLIYQLQQNGIYVNINLHVARQLTELDGFPAPKERPRYDKGVDNFDPRMIEFQKRFAKDYLTHVNPYTGLAYTNDPGIAMIEINNENSVASSWRCGDLDSLPEPYAGTFQKFWNEWLRKKYPSTAALRQAWECRTFPDSGELLPPGDKGTPLENWQYIAGTNGNSSFQVTEDSTLLVTVVKKGETSWAPQLHRTGLKVQKGVPYTLRLKLRSPQESDIYVSVGQHGKPWNNLGFSRHLKLGKEWQEYTFHFLVNADEDNARVSFGSFESSESLEIAEISVTSGGFLGNDPTEKLEEGTISIPKKFGPLITTPRQGADFSDFLIVLEDRYWQTMYRYIKDELKAKAPVSGTQLQYGSWHAQARLDYCDIHAYWNHPGWPYKRWDPNNWYVKNTSLSNFFSTASGTANRLAAVRVWGLPLTVSEYNHPFPTMYSSEGLPMIYALGAFQNWSAIFQYTWQHSNQYDPQKVTGFFDMTANQTQLAHLPACWGMFIRRDVRPGPVRFQFTPDLTIAKEAEIFGKLQGGYHQGLGEVVDYALPLAVATGVHLPETVPMKEKEGVQKIRGWGDLPQEFGSPEKGWIRNETGELYYDFQRDGKGYFTVDTPQCKIFTGFVDGRTFAFQQGDLELRPGKTRLDWLTFSLVAADENRILLTATGMMVNQGMELERLENERLTCRSHWGDAPVLCEGIPAEILIPQADRKRRFYALNAAGNRKTEIPIEKRDSHDVLRINPKYQTLWYELEWDPL
ncbi:MAG: carbohydrate binding domain-containing protein [Planctomycetia bacterium]|nr:carbohydrate binding domain-containing protein [Planctomycetia bacterium]